MNPRLRFLGFFLLIFAGCMAPGVPVVPNDASKWTIEVTSSDPKPTGPIRIFDEQNRLMLDGSLVAGQMDGTWTGWSSQKDRLVIWTYRAGVRNGPIQMWYGRFAIPEAAGRLKLEGAFLDGKYDGAVTRNHPSGARRSVRIYKNGTIESARCWAPDGTEQTPAFTADVAAEEHKADMLYLEQLEGIVTRSLAQAHRRNP